MTTASRKRKEREDLARRIDISGIDMIPCSECDKHTRHCVVGEGSKKCSSCTSLGIKCDAETVLPTGWRSLEREEERLDAELLRTQQVIAENSARAARIMKQRGQLKSRAREMLRRGLRTLDELDEAEAKEKEEKEAQERAAISSAALAESSWLEPLSEEQLNQLFLDFPEGTVELQPSR
jgi:hypothetical protein